MNWFHLIRTLLLLNLGIYGFAQDENSNEPTRACGKPVIVNSRIVGGQNTKKGQNPWQVILWIPGEGQCGGTLISSNFVLTAAHCVERVNASSVIVILGAHKITGNHKEEVSVPVKRIIKHHLYNEKAYTFDIALLELSRHVPFTDFILPACLPTSPTEFLPGHSCMVTGWGDTEFNSTKPSPDLLQEAEVRLMGLEHCREIYLLASNDSDSGITDDMICAMNIHKGKDSCQKTDASIKKTDTSVNNETPTRFAYFSPFRKFRRSKTAQIRPSLDIEFNDMPINQSLTSSALMSPVCPPDVTGPPLMSLALPLAHFPPNKKGDSGGPLICYENDRWYLVGIASFGEGCGGDFPGVYSSIPAHMEWIRSFIPDVSSGSERIGSTPGAGLMVLALIYFIQKLAKLQKKLEKRQNLAKRIEVNGNCCLVGILSFGIDCGQDFPGVYTSVSAIVHWIHSCIPAACSVPS
ncbi:hypothetical protein XELAEV_18047974mg [Xenopus laevis]|uniref:Peptidase S1 domain-containing protein n=1 Tax=Xenopus laevis TaxID=8355 RepID=A0A974BWB3_XENLA|nr:hypothetical protein XELAEV_18047974mg [Xenopus laevis]